MNGNQSLWSTAAGLVLCTCGVFADEPLFKATRQSVDGGGVMRSTGGAFELSGTFSQPDAGVVTGGELDLSGGFWFGVSPTDCDEDGAVGFLDSWRFLKCVTGSNGAVSADCVCLDVDRSGTVDLYDFAVLQAEVNDGTAPPSDPGLTTVEGFVQAEDGSPVAGAEVRIQGQPDLLAVSRPGGRFYILNVNTALGLIHVKASKQIEGGLLATGANTGLPPCANGITDVGAITIAAGGADLDGDKLPDALEPSLGYDPTLADTDGDGIIDGLEDPDGDGVADCLEIVLGTDPANPDTDADFLDDSQELDFRTDPTLADTDADGIIDGEEVEFDSDPLSNGSLPSVLSQRFGHAFGLLGSVEQLAGPAPNVPLRAAFASAPIALENIAAPPPLDLPELEAFGPDVSVNNHGVP
jgi:hypothetical protein